MYKMSLALFREYLNLVDENTGGRGFVQPCQIHQHIISQGIDPRKAALLTGLISVMGTVATGAQTPFVLRTEGPDRAAIEIPHNLDQGEILKLGSIGLRNQVLAIAEALLIPKISTGLTRKFVPSGSGGESTAEHGKAHRKTREKGEKKSKSDKGSKKKRAGNPLKLIEMLMQNRALITSLLGPLVTRILKR